MANLKNEEPDNEPLDLRQSRKKIVWSPMLLPTRSEPSEPDDRPVGRPVDHPTLLMFNTLKTL
jgi:hypothetical protein